MTDKKNLPTPPAQQVEVEVVESVPVPTGFEPQVWNKAVKKVHGFMVKIHDKHNRLNKDVLPLFFQVGSEAESLVGKKDSGTQKSAVDAFAKATESNRTTIQKCQAFYRSFGNDSMKELIAGRREMSVDAVTYKDICAFLCECGITFSAVNELCVLKSPKVILDFIRKVVDGKLSVRELRKQIKDLTDKKPELLTDASAKRRAQKDKEIRDAGGEKKHAKTPKGACTIVEARATSYMDVAGEIELTFSGLDTMTPTDCKTLTPKIEETVQVLESLKDVLGENIKSLKKGLTKAKKRSEAKK